MSNEQTTEQVEQAAPETQTVSILDWVEAKIKDITAEKEKMSTHLLRAPEDMGLFAETLSQIRGALGILNELKNGLGPRV